MSIKLSLREQVLLRKNQIQIEKLRKQKHVSALSVIFPNEEFFPKQVNYLLAPQFETGMKGGQGSGKSRLLTAKAILNSHDNPGVLGMMTGNSYDGLTDAVEAHFEDLCLRNNIPYEIIPSNHEYKLVFGYRTNKEVINIIKLYGADKPKFLKGKDVAFNVCDEWFSFKRPAVRECRSRVRNVKAKRLNLSWGGTPETENMQHGHEYFEIEKYSDEYLYYDVMYTTDNIFLHEGFLKNLYDNYTAKEVDAFIYAKLVNLTGENAYYAFERESNVIAHDEIDIPYTGATVFLTYDFNVGYMTASEIIINKKNADRIVVDVHVQESSNTKKLTQATIASLKRKYDVESLFVVITGDATGTAKDSTSDRNDYEIIKAEFEQSDIQFSIYLPKKVNPAVKARVDSVNNEFEKRTLWISDNCKKAIEDFELVTWKEGTDKFFLDQKNNRSHISDNIGYMVHNTKGYVNSLLSDRPRITVIKRERRW